jgi:outer membrane protein TolC
MNFIKITILFLGVFVSINAVKAQQRDLNFYLDKAIESSPLLHKNKNEAQLAQLDLNQIKTILAKPEITVEANVLFAPIISHNVNGNHFELVSNSATNYNGYDLSVSNGGQYQALIALKQPLFTNANYKKYAEKAAISNQQIENNTQLTIHEISQLVRNQYILCLKAKKESEVSLEQLIELKNQVEIMRKLVKNALYKQTDLLLLQIEYQNNELAYQTATANYKINVNDLNSICGVLDTTLVDLKEIDFEINPAISSKSKFLTSFELDSLSYKADQTINDLKYKPQVSLIANSGLNAVYQPAINRIGLSAGVSFVWTVFDGNQKKLQHKKLQTNLETLAFNKDYFAKQNTIYKSNLLAQINSLDEKTALLNTQILEYKKLFDAYYLEFSQSIISIMDLKNVQKDLISKKLERVQLQMEKQALINMYNYWNY